MTHKAIELFTATPKRHNCAQAVAGGIGRDDLFGELAVYGGGRAPNGVCGALYAALMFVKPENQAVLKEEFALAAGALTCREIKTITKFPCVECVRKAVELVEKYR